MSTLGDVDPSGNRDFDVPTDFDFPLYVMSVSVLTVTGLIRDSVVSLL